jgi:hypothetical protein
MAIGTSKKLVDELLGNSVKKHTKKKRHKKEPEQIEETQPEPKQEIPDSLVQTLKSRETTPIGYNVYRNHRTPFGLEQIVRLRHMWLVGRTGCGKSTLLENMAISDIYAGRGFTFLDPHGETIDQILHHCKPRADDVIWLSPGDTEYPFGLNMLEYRLPGEKQRVCSDVISVLKKQYSYSWGPRLEDILRNSLLLLLDNPGTTMIELNRVLTNETVRQQMLLNCSNAEVSWWFNNVFGGWSEKIQMDAVQPVLNKISQFLTNPVARNIFGQSKSSMNYVDAMNSKKIILCDLSKGSSVGADINNLIGSLTFARIWMGALSRQSGQREPHYLYVDEFQNFSTEENTMEILSEARKYALGCILANQYKSQIPKGIADAITENVGTLACFRVGPETATSLEMNFKPQLTKVDLSNQNNWECYIRTMVGRETTVPFSCRTFPPEPGDDSIVGIVKQMSREKYCKHHTEVEAEIEGRTGNMGTGGAELPPLPSGDGMMKIDRGDDF